MKNNTTPSVSVAAVLRGGPIRWLVLGGGFLIAAIAVGATLMAGNFRERALHNAERELENTVLLLARHFGQQLEDFEVVQKDLIGYMRANGVTTAEDYRRQMSGEAIHRMIKSKMSALSYVGGVHLFDDDGRLINTSSAWPAPAVNIADRPYFRTFKSDPRAPEMTIEPVYSRITGIWTTVLARRVTGANGEFIGVVGRGIESANFEKFFATIALAPDSAISMYHRDGTLLARHPHVAEIIGKNFSTSGAPELRAAFEQPATTSRRVSPIDGKDRLASSRALSRFPLVVVAATTTEAALADWREQIAMLVTIATASAFAIAALLLLVVRKLSDQHRQSQRRLTLEKRRLDTAVNHMTQGLLLFDSSQRLVICNRRYIEMYGLSADVVKPGCSFREIIAHRKESGSFTGNVGQYVERVLRDIDQRNAMVIDTPDGRSIQVVNEPLADGGWVATHEDITERRRVEERITHLAHYDALTDLPNRALFHEQIKLELSHASADRQLAVLYIDIDEFKSVNDSLGHLIGDELLKSVAASLRGCVRESDFVARLGGDEFAIVLTSVSDPGDVADLVDRVYAAIRTPYDCLGHQVTADASIGIALAPQDGSDLDQILKNADLAMYAAKAAGRRTHRFFEPVMDAQVRARRQLEMDLRQAIADGGFEVYYQPCLSLRDGSITGCEALVRWRHPERGLISPAEFVPIAEDTGLINQLGEWVLATACMEAAKWSDHVKLAVNVSPVQFKSGTLALKVIAALATSGLPASRLELEITEAVLIRDDDAALAILHQLRAIGVRIALDDFGTGYSSLSYLKRFPFDKIKIDRCFVTDIAGPDGSAGIVRAVVSIATERNMTTTAEGVETAEQQRILRELGCSEMQGYLFSAPKSADVVREMLTAHRAAPAQPENGARKRKTATVS
ncbi:EAL domain-containing protein [Bradyrhizobium sp.]|uniref:bifunctional diguanylate cyclase/phosphodiesterase n=1 Tax=Bradyrhizobium sp. TaxID=376 RepID=UPI001D9C41C4|nr:EAL domain-containing protein [Bradyrhizobium sp.]MBI5319788.1 EAL domain-containing protein [Bradyrhizobium sp.]